MYRDWPAWACLIAKHRIAGEIGVGDTLSRYLARIGAERATHVLERLTGWKDWCGCVKHRDWLNKKYPYS